MLFAFRFRRILQMSMRHGVKSQLYCSVVKKSVDKFASFVPLAVATPA